MPSTPQKFPWFIMVIMSSVTFMAILPELLPSGILPQMVEGVGINHTQVGFLVGVYALATAVFTIPLVSFTLAINRKKLLIWLLIGLSISNVLVGLSSSYHFIVICRVVGGICACMLWPMIAAYGTRIAPANQHGRAIAVVMAGVTLGISIGVPVMTSIGTLLSWRAPFILIGLLTAIVAMLNYLYLPSVEGEKLGKSNSPFAVLKMPSMLIIMTMTSLTVTAHYAVYTYVSLLIESIHFAGGIRLALVIFGIGSAVSVVIFARYIDQYLQTLIVSMLGLGAISMAMFILFSGTNFSAGTSGLAHLAFFLWGIAFGPVVTMFQAAVSRQIESAKDVATSVQSSTFNFSIMIASYVGGRVIVESSIISVVYLALFLFLCSSVIALLAKRTLG
jgi:predicted MFS family arabinose efflux permease